MRRADAIWYWNGSAIEDVTVDLSEMVGSSVTLSQDEILYVGYHDWLSGILFDVTTNMSTAVTETYDGRTDTWRILPVQETISQGLGTATRDITAYNFDKTGMVYWGTSPYMWQTKMTTNTWPENLGAGNPPFTDDEYFWVRVRNTGASPLTIIRVLPAPYNTYTDVEEIRQFAGLPDQIKEDTDPTATYVRQQIRAHEDQLDNYTRKSWRLRPVFNEIHNFSPYGLESFRYPLWKLNSVYLWRGNGFDLLQEGRDQDYYYDPTTGMIYFTWVTLGMRPYRFQMNRYVQQPQSIILNYIYGEDFDISEQRQMVDDIIKSRVAADLAVQTTWSASFVTGDSSSMSKSEMVKDWRENADQKAALLRGVLIK